MQEHRPKNDTQQLILDVIHTSDAPLTRTQIARALNRKKTPHLTSIIDEMVRTGILSRNVITFHNGVEGYTYTASNGRSK